MSPCLVRAVGSSSLRLVRDDLHAGAGGEDLAGAEVVEDAEEGEGLVDAAHPSRERLLGLAGPHREADRLEARHPLLVDERQVPDLEQNRPRRRRRLLLSPATLEHSLLNCFAFDVEFFL